MLHSNNLRRSRFPCYSTLLATSPQHLVSADFVHKGLVAYLGSILIHLGSKRIEEQIDWPRGNLHKKHIAQFRANTSGRKGELDRAQHISNTQSNCCTMISDLETLRSRRMDPKKYRTQDGNVIHYRKSLPRKEVREERTISAAGSRRRLRRRRREIGRASCRERVSR